jgi:hypothetical protein
VAFINLPCSSEQPPPEPPGRSRLVEWPIKLGFPVSLIFGQQLTVFPSWRFPLVPPRLGLLSRGTHNPLGVFVEWHLARFKWDIRWRCQLRQFIFKQLEVNGIAEKVLKQLWIKIDQRQQNVLWVNRSSPFTRGKYLCMKQDRARRTREAVNHFRVPLALITFIKTT